MQTTWEIIEGDCRASLAALQAGSVQNAASERLIPTESRAA